ncbi:MAG: ATP-binding protein [Clostridia bacterium]|nr:ATP-binding protein [Clostridia bacterium]
MIHREALIHKKMEECEQKIKLLHERFPRLKEIAEEISRLSYEMINVGILKKNRFRAAQIDKEVKLLLKEKELILKANSIPLNIYEPEWDCPKCQDRGYIDPGVLCECYKRERLDAIFQQSGISGNNENKTFANFDVSFYRDAKSMQDKVERCKEFALKVVKKENQNNLFFTGPVGRGKTHLSLAIANEVLKQGATVIYKRIDDLLDIIREYKYNREGEQLDKNFQLDYLKNVDLLIIDDLAAENITPFAQNQIRIIIEDRNNYNKPWIINSNLNINELQDYYGQRVTDRIIEKADIFSFESEMSIRELLKKREIESKNRGKKT